MNNSPVGFQYHATIEQSPSDLRVPVSFLSFSGERTGVAVVND